MVKEKHLATRSSNKMVIDLPPADIPHFFDWRDYYKIVVPPVIDRSECSAGMFADVDSMTALQALNSDNKFVLGSYEEFIDCCLKGSCNGTFAHNLSLYQCVVDLGGLALAEQYNSTNHKCNSNLYPPVIKINGAAYVTAYDDEQTLTTAVAQRGPVAVAVDANHQSFLMYEKGIYYNSNCSSTSLDHSMLVVGFGTENDEDYWIVKNSWGK